MVSHGSRKLHAMHKFAVSLSWVWFPIILSPKTVSAAWSDRQLMNVSSVMPIWLFNTPWLKVILHFFCQLESKLLPYGSICFQWLFSTKMCWNTIYTRVFIVINSHKLLLCIHLFFEFKLYIRSSTVCVGCRSFCWKHNKWYYR